jgi:hypothetical protein
MMPSLCYPVKVVKTFGRLPVKGVKLRYSNERNSKFERGKLFMPDEIVLGRRLNKHTNRSSTRGVQKIYHSFIRIKPEGIFYVRMGTYNLNNLPLSLTQFAEIQKSVRLKKGSFGLTPHQSDVWKLDDMIEGRKTSAAA